jgi:hypothetical protein
MLFQCTKKLLDKLNIDTLSKEEFDDIYSWHANLIEIKNKLGVVFVNDMTKYSVILLNLKSIDFKNIEELFFQALRKTLNQECIKESIIEDYIKGTSNIHFSKTKDRKHISTMNEVVRFVEGMYSSRIENSMFQIPLCMKINRALFKKDGKYIQPNLELYKYFKEKYGEDIYEADGYRLKITLDTGEGVVTRIVDIPINASFYNLHKVIMESFGWDDDHLHEFYISGIKNPDIIVSNDRVIFREEYDDKVKNELETYLIGIIKAGDRFEYLYDFGDDWLHEIEVLDIIKGYNKNYPICTIAEGWITDEVDIKLINSNLKDYYW